MRGVETKWRRLGDVVRGMETISRGLEVILSDYKLFFTHAKVIKTMLV